jgi:leader peptidase (prepilin peptidase)/N-methyltransferase
MPIAIYVFVFIVGLLLGSFFNVLILRLPKGQDFVYQRSHCPGCGSQIPWYLNIPIFSYLYLRGKCKSCDGKISLQYPLIELTSGILAVLVLHFKASLDPVGLYKFFFYYSVVSIFLCHIIIDIRHKILPNILTGYLALLFMADRFLYGSWHMTILGGAIGLLFPLLVTYVFYKIKGVIGLGGGDIKLYGTLGLLLGPYSVVHTIFMSCLVGSVFSLLMIAIGKMDRKSPIPFGPFIIVVGFVQILFPGFLEQLIS